MHRFSPWQRKVYANMKRQSSIENEPRTLNNNQIELAREVARYVVNTRSDEEALNFFTKGLEPVVKCGGGGGADGELTSDAWAQDYENIRDILTAPF